MFTYNHLEKNIFAYMSTIKTLELLSGVILVTNNKNLGILIFLIWSLITCLDKNYNHR